jgi:hypothetical protein
MNACSTTGTCWRARVVHRARPARTRAVPWVAYVYRALTDGQMSVCLAHFAYPPHGLFGGQPGRGSELVVDPGGRDERVQVARHRRAEPTPRSCE